MRNDNGKLGVVLLAVLIAVALIASLYSTQFTISDTDPTTYVIIPMLMLPVFALFYAKRSIRPAVGRRDIIAGLLLFLALVLATGYLRVGLSYLFASYNIDMLLFPLLIASFVVLIFGLGNLRRFWLLMLYSVFASPLLLMPIIGINPWFASVNTQIVYGVLGPFLHNATYSAPITIVANGYRIGIGESCIGVGLLIAIVLLLVPIAYLYGGSIRRRAMWVASGLGLFFLLNVFRMLLIAGLWVSGGPNDALALFHSFAGMLLFYAVVIIMILASFLYGIGIEPAKRKRQRRGDAGSPYSPAAVALAAIVAIAYLLLGTSQYNALRVSPYAVAASGVPAGAMLHLDSVLSNTTYLYGTVINSSGSSLVMRLYNKTNSSVTTTSPILLYASFGNASGAVPRFVNSTAADRLSFINAYGIRQDVYYVVSGGVPFIFYSAAAPYVMNSTYSVLTFYAVVPANDMSTAKCSANYAYLYSSIFNDMNLRFYNATAVRDMSTGACIIGGAISDAV
ncbi:MAG: exosortase/archaeosortase family protein [Candidatus Marsarchaeota archaeon]|nr:exosortase/archaeosortase family protein [Candidatus Marsarchaeota archaeon]